MNARCAARSSAVIAATSGTRRSRTMIGSPNGCARHRRLRQHELRLAGADQFDIDFGQKFGIKQRAMLGAAGIVDGIAHAKIVEPI